MADSSATDVDDLTYEQARDGLIAVVTELEQGSSSLEQSLALWERGEALAGRCEQWLFGAKARLDSARANATAGSATSGSATSGSATSGSATSG